MCIVKNANITPVFKKGHRNSEINYRPVSILPNLSKIYERCLYKQLPKFFDKILSKYQCGFRKGFNSQCCLATMLEKWRETIDKGDCFGALLTDLSKAFDCILHDLLIAKLHAYNVDMKFLRFPYSYLNAENNELKLTINIVPLKKYYLKYLRVLSLGLYSLTFLSVIFF